MSSADGRRKRGEYREEDVRQFAGQPFSFLAARLSSKDAVVRSAAAENMDARNREAACLLLMQLSGETCLYTRLALCRSLERGNGTTAELMVRYLGKIGRNQYTAVSPRPSLKKSYPLPRDIVARTLARMDAAILPSILAVFVCGEPARISEAVDAAGWMIGHHPECAVQKNLRPFLMLLETYAEDDLIVWKVITALSAFSCEDSGAVLSAYAAQGGRLADEARRSIACRVQ